MKHLRIGVALVSLIVFAMAAKPSLAQRKAEPVKSLRVYLFDCGMIKGLDPSAYQLKKEDLKSTDMVVPCYLIVHPKGTLMWDVGLIPDSAFKGGCSCSPTPWLWDDKFFEAFAAATGGARLSAGGHHLPCPFALSFRSHRPMRTPSPGSTWLVHATEREAMFAVKPELQTAYDQLQNSKTVILPEHGL